MLAVEIVVGEEQTLHGGVVIQTLAVAVGELSEAAESNCGQAPYFRTGQ